VDSSCISYITTEAEIKKEFKDRNLNDNYDLFKGTIPESA
jgi:hypothetical protein